MTLEELIAILRKFLEERGDKWVKYGFNNPHSYRGYYDNLAFEPEQEVSVKQMLKDAEYALNNTFQGYKGGDFTMTKDTPVWLAYYGASAQDPLTSYALAFMLGLKDPPMDIGESTVFY